MAGRAEERGRRDNAAETIEQTFLKLQAGSVAEQKRDSRDSGDAPAEAGPRERRKGGTTRLNLADVLGLAANGQMPGAILPAEPDIQRLPSPGAPARTSPRGRRKGGTTRLELADVFGPSEAAEQGGVGVPPVESGNQRPQPFSKAPARTHSRERRRGSTTRLDWADVLGSNEAALQIRRQAPSGQPDNNSPEAGGERRQNSQTADPLAAVQSNPGPGFKAQSEPIAGNEQPSGEASGREFDGTAATAADTGRARLAALSQTPGAPGAALVDGQLTLTRVDVHDKARLASVPSQSPEVNIFDNGSEIIIMAALPGLELKTLAVTSDGRGLAITATRRVQPGLEGALCRRRERSGAPFVRVIQLPQSLELTRATATYRNGLLEIRAPKGEPAFRITVL